MPPLNHFSISAALGSTLGASVHVAHGQIGSSELAATLSSLMARHREYAADLLPDDDVERRYEKAITRAFLQTRQGFSSDRVLADPRINRRFIAACRDFGLQDSVFNLNLALIGLRKHNKLQFESRRSFIPDQWKCGLASEVAVQVLRYRYGTSSDTTLSHPDLSKEFQHIASTLTPGFSALQYRWAALNMRKKGSGAKIRMKQIQELGWHDDVRFFARNIPATEGVYQLFERDTCLFVAGTENLKESIASQRRIASIELFEPTLWKPDPAQLHWRYADMPRTNSTFRFGVVRSLVGHWQPVFNVPRGRQAA